MCETRSRVGAAVASRTFGTGEPCLAWSMTRLGAARGAVSELACSSPAGARDAGVTASISFHALLRFSFFRFRRAFRCDGTIFQTGMNHIASPHLPQRRGMGEGAVLEFT
jgi:hypothetical protein